ncbi:MAG TPA: class I SAM-dependent methyltransferase [Crocinitomicaceae bacterium]|nr:class I SAM-dependent methyltransferase [Crocinitomicaceae bacterium]
MTKDWFADWFDSPYYHILYKNRDEIEANLFISRLVSFIELPKESTVLDLACGKGRHAKMLFESGFNVLGVDLSPQSIEFASQESVKGLDFQVHDMREVIQGRKFTAIFNLFTSFGYFDSEAENLKMLDSIHSMLEKDGLLIIDFMNAVKVIDNLVEKEEKIVDDVKFDIERRYDGQHIFKDIRFIDGKINRHYTERVQAVKISDFEKMLTATNFKILRTFGDFNLNDFDETTSDRLIIIAQKKQ